MSVQCTPRPRLPTAVTDSVLPAVKANSSEDPKSRLDDEELIAEMFTLTLAGHETTSSTLSFLLYELSRNQEYQARMRDEIRSVRARITARGGNEFTIEDLESLTLTMNAIKVCVSLSLTDGKCLTVSNILRKRLGSTPSSSVCRACQRRTTSSRCPSRSRPPLVKSSQRSLSVQGRSSTSRSQATTGKPRVLLIHPSICLTQTQHTPSRIL